VSLLSRNELRVVLNRDQVQLVSYACDLTLKGWTYQIVGKQILPCAESADTPWGNALMTLDTALSELAQKPACAHVVLSNHFMRYTMVPWSENLSNDAEELAYAKHCFIRAYGADAETWELLMNHDIAGTAQLACAVDRELLKTLRALFARVNVKLKSVQPHLMTAYNNCHASLKNNDAWLALFEQGCLCLGFVRQGHWNSVRTLKVKSDWLEKLPEMLDREVSLSELDSPSDEVFLWAPEHWKASLPKSVQWKIRMLQPALHPGVAPQYEARFAMAMCG